jgi:hypothetical protein
MELTPPLEPLAVALRYPYLVPAASRAQESTVNAIPAERLASGVNGGDNGSKQKASCCPTKKKVNGAQEGAQVVQVRTR